MRKDSQLPVRHSHGKMLKGHICEGFKVFLAIIVLTWPLWLKSSLIEKIANNRFFQKHFFGKGEACSLAKQQCAPRIV